MTQKWVRVMDDKDQPNLTPEASDCKTDLVSLPVVPSCWDQEVHPGHKPRPHTEELSEVLPKEGENWAWAHFLQVLNRDGELQEASQHFTVSNEHEAWHAARLNQTFAGRN